MGGKERTMFLDGSVTLCLEDLVTPSQDDLVTQFLDVSVTLCLEDSATLSLVDLATLSQDVLEITYRDDSAMPIKSVGHSLSAVLVEKECQIRSLNLNLKTR